jgi:hypothetical protein
LDLSREQTSADEVAEAAAILERSGSLEHALAEVADRRSRAIGVPELGYHQQLKAAVEAMCDLFLDPIRPLLDGRARSSAHALSSDLP